MKNVIQGMICSALLLGYSTASFPATIAKVSNNKMILDLTSEEMLFVDKGKVYNILDNERDEIVGRIFIKHISKKSNRVGGEVRLKKGKQRLRRHANYSLTFIPPRSDIPPYEDLKNFVDQKATKQKQAAQKEIP